MGTLMSTLHAADFTASYAPIEGCICASCDRLISGGSVRLTRHILCPNGGLVATHYHLAHGLHSASNLRCPCRVRRQSDVVPPKLYGTSRLRPQDAADVEARFAHAQAAWMARCMHTD